MPQNEEQYWEYLGGLIGHGARVVNVYGWNIPWIARSPYRVKSSGVVSAIQAKMARLQGAARQAASRGRNPLVIQWIVWRFQREFEPLMRASRYEEADAVLDRALAKLEMRP